MIVRFSVIVPVYNVNKYVTECVESIVCQEGVTTDQGAVYASKKYNDILKLNHMAHSMSRAGTPMDNAAMEAINGWLKAELFTDFHVTGKASVELEIEEYIKFFNEKRPAYALGYMTPKRHLIIANYHEV